MRIPRKKREQSLQGIYKAVFHTEDRIDVIQSQLEEIKTLLINLLKQQQSVIDFEKNFLNSKDKK